MESLLIKLDQNHPTQAQWVVIGNDGTPHAAIREGSLALAREHAKQRRIICTMPSSDIALNQVTLPANRNRRKLLQAAPFALEDDLAEDLDNLHLAFGKETQNTVVAAEDDEEGSKTTTKTVNIPVAIASRETVENWLSTLEDFELKPHIFIPDVLTVPLREGEWSVLIDHETALIRTDKLDGLACDLDNLQITLQAIINEIPEEERPTQIRIWSHNEEEHMADLDLAMALEVPVDTTNTDQAALSTLARGYRKEDQINLLQGDYSYREEYGKLFKPWRLPAALLAVWVIVAFGANMLEYQSLKSEKSALLKQQKDIYKSAFPGARNIPRPVSQMRTKLIELGAGGESSEGEFLPLLKLAANEIGPMEATNITSINFSDEHLDIELSVPNLQILDQLKERLDKQEGVSTELQNAKAEGKEVTGRLRLVKS